MISEELARTFVRPARGDKPLLAHALRPSNTVVLCATLYLVLLCVRAPAGKCRRTMSDLNAPVVVLGGFLHRPSRLHTPAAHTALHSTCRRQWLWQVSSFAENDGTPEDGNSRASHRRRRGALGERTSTSTPELKL